MKFIGIDYGIKRIGLAHGDDDTRIAFPLDTIAGRNDVTRDARNVADRGEAEGAEAYVVGLPINMDDSEGDQAALTRRFAGELDRLSGKRVHFQDERLSSAAAHEAMNVAGLRGRKRKALTDQLAARQILQAYFDRDETR
ncbi:MAG: Holliday junction resolvase RuvX [Phycisphaerales bacterium]|nr:Holliday junction resolvase RuvX [Phycisphaerales bacterium]MCB9856871.1 Holliday junction resolvase RuvX [Phycisphaerales bacterium]MCB9862002.1 Holliday junction resolvase RuvX [Phycisphaerales bacterium]